MYVLASNIPRRIANQYTKVGDYPVVVYVDKTKLKNFTDADEILHNRWDC